MTTIRAGAGLLFSREEYAGRLEPVRAQMRRRQCDVSLLDAI